MNNLHILTDEQLVKMAQEGSETAEELLIEKYKRKEKHTLRALSDNRTIISVKV